MDEPSRWRSKMRERKCPCDDGPTELGRPQQHCPIHDGPEEDADIDPWGEPE